jgi:hypothetical protein
MRAALKAGVLVVPVLAAILLLRSCAESEGDRWLARARTVDPLAQLAVDEEDLVVVAPDVAEGRGAGREVRRFREALVEGHADLLGRGRDQRAVVVVFSSVDRVQAFAARGEVEGRGRFEALHGFTAPQQGAIFVPKGSVRTLRHETVHLLVAEGRAGDAELSPWLSEGLAQLFEIEPPGMDAESRALVARMGVDHERLLGIADYAEFTGRDGLRNYLEALALTAFLYENRPRESLVRYVREERAGEGGRPLRFRQIYRDDEPEFRRDLAAFLER